MQPNLNDTNINLHLFVFKPKEKSSSISLQQMLRDELQGSNQWLSHVKYADV